MHLYWKSRDWLDNLLWTLSPRVTRAYWQVRDTPVEALRALYYLAKIRYLKWRYDEVLFGSHGPKYVAMEGVWLASAITIACGLGILASISWVLFVL